MALHLRRFQIKAICPACEEKYHKTYQSYTGSSTTSANSGGMMNAHHTKVLDSLYVIVVHRRCVGFLPHTCRSFDPPHGARVPLCIELKIFFSGVLRLIKNPYLSFWYFIVYVMYQRNKRLNLSSLFFVKKF